MGKAICSVATCERPVRSLGWCSTHYTRNRRHGDPTYTTVEREWNPPICAAMPCEKRPVARGWCAHHYHVHWTLIKKTASAAAKGSRISRGSKAQSARRDPRRAERKFLARLAELNATLIEPEYLGARVPHRVICVNGHQCAPRPNNAHNAGICKECAGCDRDVAEIAFREKLAKLGATLLESKYRGRHRPHRIRCSAGHEVVQQPNNIMQGNGVCRTCTLGSPATIFYVVVNEAQCRVKFGITSGDGRVRLGYHRRAGYRTVVRLIDGLSDAFLLERHVIKILGQTRVSAVKGREYFDISALALILDIVDNYPAAAAS